jgi:hypothetical protein
MRKILFFFIFKEINTTICAKKKEKKNNNQVKFRKEKKSIKYNYNIWVIIVE